MSNLGQMTGFSSNNVAKEKQKSFDETTIRHIPKNGISTISSAIREQSINPRKDNYGLYALKQDRSMALENTKRGILLSIPSTTRIHTRAEIHSFHSTERNHEIFQSCEKVVNSSEIMHEGNYSTSPHNDNKVMRVEPPPRKKRQTATRQIVPHTKKTPIVRQAHATHSVVKEETLENNDNELYRIAKTEKAKVMVEEPKKKEHLVTMVKPKIQKAERVKFQREKPPIVPKVKSYEWQKHQRKASVGNINIKPPLSISSKKKYLPSESSSSIRSDNSVDIFQSNRLKDQQKLFDEFDELFKKNKDGNLNEEPTAESALRKLRELKKSSSTSSSSPLMERKQSQSDDIKPSSLNVKTLESFKPKAKNEVSVLDRTVERVEEISSKPKIVFEQPKATSGVITKKIVYYDDEKELKQQLIMNQTQSTTIINNHFSSQIIPNLIQSKNHEISTILNDYGVGGKMPISITPNSIMKSTGQKHLESQFDDTSVDYHRHLIKQQKVAINANTTDKNGNSLRIFSNEGIFVFNL